MKTPRPKDRDAGVALVSTMIVLAVLAIVAVAFMQSATTDRISSRSGTNYYQALLAAEGGAAMARATVSSLFGRYPDSATVWQNIGSGQTNEATVLYARAQAADVNRGARPGQFSNDVAFLGFPLVSIADSNNRTRPDTNANNFLLTAISNRLPFASTDSEMVNLNATNSSRPTPMVGLRTTTNNPGAPVTAAQWIYLTRNGQPTNTTNPPVARFAYWIEDESFKVNVNVASSGPRGQTSLGLSPAEVRLDGSWSASTDPQVSGASAGAVVTARGALGSIGFPTASTAALAAGLTATSSVSEIRFLSTAHSAGLDLSRGGFKRVNINSFTNGVTDDNSKRTALDRIVATITNTNAMPFFGQRFYRLANNVPGINSTNAVATEHADIYLQKIAANIYDYLDDDDQPTVINNDASFSLRTGRPAEPILALGGGEDGTNSVAAFGVENFPRLQEWAMHARVWRMSYDANPNSKNHFGFVQNTNAGATNPTQANYEIWLDYYFEFYNPGTREITVTNAFITLEKLPAFRGVSTSDALYNERSITNIPFSGTFPAGQVTILSTAPLNEDSAAANSDGGIITNRMQVIYLPVSTNDRKFTGVTTSITNQAYDPTGDKLAPPNPNFNRLFQITMVPGPQTKGSILIGNDSGILESFVGLPFNAQSNPNATGMALRVGSGWIRNGLQTIGDGNNDNIRAGSLRGNSGNVNARPSATEGDPRTLNEQLEFLNYNSANNGGDFDVTRFFDTLSGASIPASSTFGGLNTNYVFATNWTDTSAWQPNSNNAPLFVRNGAMQSIGELGHITDPARAMGSSGNIARARGGGRTLRVGQPELTNAIAPWRQAWYTGNQTSASRTWTSWRLADVFTAATNTNVVIPGLINPNGALRDNGAALRAALFGLTFLPTSPEGAISIAGRPANVTNVVTNMIARLTNGNAAGLGAGTLNPLWERGEISELSVLNSSASSSVAQGTIMSNAFDRGREELVRRSIEMITTRGSVFTVYAVGQTLQVNTNTATATTNFGAQVRLRQTFEVTPVFPTNAMTTDAFNVPDLSNTTNRFTTVTNFLTRIISTSYD